MSRTNTLSVVYDILLSPVPFLPKGSLIPKHGRIYNRNKRQRRRALAEGISRTLNFTLKGEIDRGNLTKFSINGEDFVIDKDTWIFGEVRAGVVAVVKGVKIGGANFARKVMVEG